ncbi:unnamed protein product [Larinioides sclopetarius]|uniref:chitinase n=1 Tax=Larinioides sclopetarius TaxID=280406 RepID=A0AAV2BTG4_9ARAC
MVSQCIFRNPSQLTMFCKRLKFSINCLNFRMQHNLAKVTNQTCEYPPIVDMSEEGQRRHQRLLWYDSIKAMPTVEEKFYELAVQQRLDLKKYFLTCVPPSYTGIFFNQFITRTHLMEGLPDKINHINVEDELSDIKDTFNEVLLNYYHNPWQNKTSKQLSDYLSEKGAGARLLNQLVTQCFKKLASKNEHILESTIQHKPRINSFWWHNGFESKDNELHERNLAFRYEDFPAFVIRMKKPLSPIVDMNDPLCATAEVLNYNYQPEVFDFPCNESDWLSSVPGFTPFHDITYPFVGQTILTNGQDFTFFVYQLNTIAFHEDMDNKDRRNLCWTSGKLRLFETIEDGQLKGVNEEVYRLLLKFMLNAPEVKEGQVLKPYLGVDTRTEEEIKNMRFFLRRMYSQKRAHDAHKNEVPMWFPVKPQIYVPAEWTWGIYIVIQELKAIFMEEFSIICTHFVKGASCTTRTILEDRKQFPSEVYSILFTKMSTYGLVTILAFTALHTLYASPVKNAAAPFYQAGKTSSHKYKVVCYYGSWAVYRPGDGKFPVEEIDPFICTHLIYGFVGLGFDNKIRCLDPYYDLEENYGKGAFNRFNNLKKINPELKTIVAIGGWNEGSTRYSNMASSPATRKIFVDSAVEFVKKYGFNGLDMDWEYPATRGGKPEDKQNFVALLRELKTEFQKHNLLLTAAVSAGKHTIDEAYDIPQVSQYLDFINVMCYDYHGGWESFTGHNAPLYARPDDNKENQMLNLNFSINYWISKGAPREKLILGMGLYGRSFTLQRAEVNGFNASAPQKGRAGPYTREPGSLGYNEICEFQKQQKWNIVWDDYYMAPYAYQDRQWVGYDNEASIRLKVNYAKYYKLGGGMVWSVETDDFKGKCGRKYGLLTAINEEFANPSVALPLPPPAPVTSVPTISTSGAPYSPPTTPSTTSTTTTTTTTTPRPVTTPSTTTTTTPSPVPSTSKSPHHDPVETPTFICTQSGLQRDPRDCQKFHSCVSVHGPTGSTFLPYEFSCPPGTVFDDKIQGCNSPALVPGCENSTTQMFSFFRPNF